MEMNKILKWIVLCLSFILCNVEVVASGNVDYENVTLSNSTCRFRIYSISSSNYVKLGWNGVALMEHCAIGFRGHDASKHYDICVEFQKYRINDKDFYMEIYRDDATLSSYSYRFQDTSSKDKHCVDNVQYFFLNFHAQVNSTSLLRMQVTASEKFQLWDILTYAVIFLIIAALIYFVLKNPVLRNKLKWKLQDALSWCESCCKSSSSRSSTSHSNGRPHTHRENTDNQSHDSSRQTDTVLVEDVTLVSPPTYNPSWNTQSSDTTSPPPAYDECVRR